MLGGCRPPDPPLGRASGRAGGRGTLCIDIVFCCFLTGLQAPRGIPPHTRPLPDPPRVCRRSAFVRHAGASAASSATGADITTVKTASASLAQRRGDHCPTRTLCVCGPRIDYCAAATRGHPTPPPESPANLVPLEKIGRLARGMSEHGHSGPHKGR